MRKLLNRFLSWFASIPGEDGACEYQCDDPHDPQVQRRSIPDENFSFERWKP